MVGVEDDDLLVPEAGLTADREGVRVLVAGERGVGRAQQRCAGDRVHVEVRDDLLVGVVVGEEVAGEGAGPDLHGDGVVGAEVRGR